jgi:hypothetical protein
MSLVARKNLLELEGYLTMRVRFRVRPRRIQFHTHVQLRKSASVLYQALAVVHL